MATPGQVPRLAHRIVSLRAWPLATACFLALAPLAAAAAASEGWPAGTVFRMPDFTVQEEKTRVLAANEVDLQPRRLRISEAVYPRGWAALKIRVKVTVTFVIDTDGVPRDLQVMSVTLLDPLDSGALRAAGNGPSAGRPPLPVDALQRLMLADFREAAVTAWKTARYLPAKKDGQLVATRLEADTNFRAEAR